MFFPFVASLVCVICKGTDTDGPRLGFVVQAFQEGSSESAPTLLTKSAHTQKYMHSSCLLPLRTVIHVMYRSLTNFTGGTYLHIKRGCRGRTAQIVTRSTRSTPSH